MLATQISLKVENLTDYFLLSFHLRDRRLFTQFLVKGYRMTAVGNVGDLTLMAKINLGMLITLMDDLADNPTHFNPQLLKLMYQMKLNDPDTFEVQEKDQGLYELGKCLMKGIVREIENLPNYERFKDVLEFDLEQIFFANRYSELLMEKPYLGNLSESRLYGPYNMGMLAAGMIDLMAVKELDAFELGLIRMILIKGQRIGRIGNLISTIEREIKEGDVTNEIMLVRTDRQEYIKVLIKEIEELIFEMTKISQKVESIDLSSYIKGVEELYYLHLNMKGII